MTIYNEQRVPIATTTTRAIGREFLFGLVNPISIPGHVVTIDPHQFVTVKNSATGDIYLVEDHGEWLILTRIVLSSPHGAVVIEGQEPLRIARELTRVAA